MGLARGRAITARSTVATFALAAVLTLGVGVPAVANQVISAGGTTLVNNGLVDLACTDLSVDGTLDTGTGTYTKVRNITVGPTGVLQGNGTINYSGTLTNGGVVTINASQTSGQSNLSSLPATWPVGTRWATSRMSAYASQSP